MFTTNTLIKIYDCVNRHTHRIVIIRITYSQIRDLITDSHHVLCTDSDVALEEIFYAFELWRHT